MDQNQNENVLLGLTEQTYQLWRHQPITKAFLKYLAETAEVYRQDLIARWDSRALTLADEHEMRGVIRTLEEIADMQLAVVHRFYGVEDEAPPNS